MSKVTVNIFGKDYTIVGDQDAESIEKMAFHVDKTMKQIANVVKDASTSSVAVLSAINITEEMYLIKDALEEVDKENEQNKADTNHYIKLWEDSKKDFVEYKREIQGDLDQAKKLIEAREAEIRNKNKEIEALRNDFEKIEQRALEKVEEAKVAIEEKYKELENNYFDIQMENIQLKSEVEKLKNNLEWERNEQQGN